MKVPVFKMTENEGLDSIQNLLLKAGEMIIDLEPEDSNEPSKGSKDKEALEGYDSEGYIVEGKVFLPIVCLDLEISQNSLIIGLFFPMFKHYHSIELNDTLTKEKEKIG